MCCTNLFQNEHFSVSPFSSSHYKSEVKHSCHVHTYGYCMVLVCLSNCSGSEGNELRWMAEGLDPHSSHTVYLFMHLSPPSIHLNKCLCVNVLPDVECLTCTQTPGMTSELTKPSSLSGSFPTICLYRSHAQFLNVKGEACHFCISSGKRQMEMQNTTFSNWFPEQSASLPLVFIKQ